MKKLDIADPKFGASDFEVGTDFVPTDLLYDGSLRLRHHGAI